MSETLLDVFDPDLERGHVLLQLGEVAFEDLAPAALVRVRTGGAPPSSSSRCGCTIGSERMVEPGHRQSNRRRTVAVALGVMALAFAAITFAADSGFATLKGRWLRPDGGYVLEIRDVDAKGKMDAVYLNPRPIVVAKAEATRQGSTLTIFVELRAPGYPGSTYTLTYDAKGDQLTGVYFQAAMGQRFEVVFVRMKQGQR